MYLNRRFHHSFWTVQIVSHKKHLTERWVPLSSILSKSIHLLNHNDF